jgi:hypothetical protein
VVSKATASTTGSQFGDLINAKSGGQPSTAAKAPTPVQQPLPKNATSANYSTVQAVLIYTDTLQTALNQGGDATQWNSAREYARWSGSMLDSMKTHASSGTELVEIIFGASTIAKAVEAENSADSSMIRDWQSQLQGLYAKSQRLVAVARALPGATPRGVRLKRHNCTVSTVR